ncbi:choline-phosphate cytidylyltransferase [Cytospora paraplurivora]|uniref:choline-phosphate cytidylyltransferase n=1 Tax=Cytospora paraplurivora TaxID=2898453 RepID=A0AAN9UEC8_9PEZI
MSSPNSSPHGGSKRKRAAAASSNLADPSSTQAAMDAQLQTESRDASGEEGTTAPESTGATSQGHRKTDSSSSQHPPSKRQRGTSSNDSSEQALDQSEPSDTTEASLDIVDRVSSRRSLRGKAALNNAASKQEEESMLPPPIGKLTDPVGYKTNPPPAGRPVRVYADGVFDLFHLGHMRQLEQAKKAFPEVYLLVGVTGDEETHKRKGLTVLSGKERAETVRHCKWVDEVIENCPWIVTPAFLDEHKIDYVAHDDLPYGAAEGDDIYAPIKKEGKFLVTQRTEGVSTTGIITKIVRDYEQYIARQFKRGTSRQELNVSWLKKNELELKRHVQELRDNIRTNWTTTGQELGKELRGFWPTSRPQSPARPHLITANSTSAIPSSTSEQPLSPSASTLGPRSPGAEGRTTNDFLTGYTIGLIGGVRSWMTKSRRNLRQDSRPVSDDDSEEDRGRKSTSATNAGATAAAS